MGLAETGKNHFIRNQDHAGVICSGLLVIVFSFHSEYYVKNKRE